MFSSESELVEVFNSQYRGILKTILNKKILRNSFLINEYASCYGVPDIVIGTALSKNRKARLTCKREFYPLTQYKKNEKFTLEDLARDHCLDMSDLQKYKKLYMEKGLVKELGRGVLEKIKDVSPVAESVISIEAKLKNWKRALQQAYRYKTFSDSSYVLLDEHFSSPAIKNLGLFNKYNVGLMTIGIEGNWQILHTPRKTTKKNPYYYWHVNEEVSSYFSQIS